MKFVPDESPDRSAAVPGAIECLTAASPERVAELRAGDRFFWLNLRGAGDEALNSVGAALGLHPLTVEDLRHFGQRAKIEDYDDYVYIVSYGVALPEDADRLAEAHIVYAPQFLLTVTRDTAPELDRLHDRSAGGSISGHQLLHGVLDVLADSFAPLLDELEDAIEDIEERIFARRLAEPGQELHRLRRQVGAIARVAHRQTEAYTRLHETLRRLPDHVPEQAPYFRDVHDHLIRLTEAADGLRERIQGAFELYLAAIDSRQNAIMRQFTVIAGVFLPLTVLVGFFGMNFRWMTDNIQSAVAFMFLGLALPAAIVTALLLYSRRRGFFGD